MFSAIWNKFYNNVIRNVSPALKGGIILGLVAIGLLCLILTMRRGKKESMVGNWFLFFFGIAIIIVAVIYAFISG